MTSRTEPPNKNQPSPPKAKRFTVSSPVMRIYHHHSLHTGKRLRAEEGLEYKFVFVNSLKRDIAGIQTRASSIYYDKNSRYTPDGCIRYRSGKFEWYEIKSKRSAEEPKFIEKWERLQEVFTERGFNLRLITDDMLPNADEMANLQRFHLAYTSVKPKIEHIKLVEDLLSSGPTSLGVLADMLKTQKLSTRPVWYGLSTGIFFTDTTKFIDSTSLINIGDARDDA
jgi:hypothetical protein